MLYYIYPVVLLAALAVAGFYFRRTSKKIIFGLGFFIATILLVLQLLPVGDTVMADRYTYLPSIGIFFLAAEGFYWLWMRNKKPVALAVAAVFLIFFSAQTIARCRVWENGLTLWNDVIAQYKNVPAAFYNRGIYFFNQNQDEEALSDFNSAIALKPDYADAYNNRGSLYLKQGKPEEALKDLSKAVSLNARLAQGYFNRAYILYQKQQYKEALSDYNQVIALKPDPAQLVIVYNLRGLLFMAEKNNPAALADFNTAIQMKPDFVQAYNNRGSLWVAQGNYVEAVKDFTAAIVLKNDYAEAYYNRGIAEYNGGNKNAGSRTGACLHLLPGGNAGLPDELPVAIMVSIKTVRRKMKKKKAGRQRAATETHKPVKPAPVPEKTYTREFLIIAVLTILAYIPALRAGVVTWDDPDYVNEGFFRSGFCKLFYHTHSG